MREEFGGKSSPGLPLDNVGFKVLSNVAQTRDEDIRQALIEHESVNQSNVLVHTVLPLIAVHNEFGEKVPTGLFEKTGFQVLSSISQTRDEGPRWLLVVRKEFGGKGGRRHGRHGHGAAAAMAGRVVAAGKAW